MDETDKKICNILIENSRISISSISKKTGIPNSTISNRIRKLEENSIVKQYTTILDHENRLKQKSMKMLKNNYPSLKKLHRFTVYPENMMFL